MDDHFEEFHGTLTHFHKDRAGSALKQMPGKKAIEQKFANQKPISTRVLLNWHIVYTPYRPARSHSKDIHNFWNSFLFVCIYAVKSFIHKPISGIYLSHVNQQNCIHKTKQISKTPSYVVILKQRATNINDITGWRYWAIFYIRSHSRLLYIISE